MSEGRHPGLFSWRTCTGVYAQTHSHTHVDTHTHTLRPRHIQTHTQTLIHTQTHEHKHTHIDTYIQTHSHTQRHMDTHKRTHMHTQAHTNSLSYAHARAHTHTQTHSTHGRELIGSARCPWQAPPAKPEDLSPVPGTHRVERETSPKSAFRPPWALWLCVTHPYTHKQCNL